MTPKGKGKKGETGSAVSGDYALKILLKGNKRFVGRGRVLIGKSFEKLKEVQREQHPLAIPLGCSDSRVPPEIIFDMRLGDLFTIREAGHVVENVGLGSIEYAVSNLGVRLLVVLGHEQCGAVVAAVNGGKADTHISSVLKPLRAAVKKSEEMEGDLVDNAVRENVKNFVEKLKSSKPVIAELASPGKLKVVGAYYCLHTGEIEIITE